MSITNSVASLAGDTTGIAEAQLSTKEKEDVSVAGTNLKAQQAAAAQVKNGALLVEVYPMLHGVNGTTEGGPFYYHRRWISGRYQPFILRLRQLGQITDGHLNPGVYCCEVRRSSHWINYDPESH
jgi:hypothetical protein